MVSFKDFLEADLSNIFLNTDEFGDKHDIDGQQVDCVFDNDIIKGGISYDGVYLSTKKLYIKANNLPGRPVEGQHMKVDGDLYIVSDCSENLGMLEITLEANEA